MTVKTQTYITLKSHYTQPFWFYLIVYASWHLPNFFTNIKNKVTNFTLFKHKKCGLNKKVRLMKFGRKIKNICDNIISFESIQIYKVSFENFELLWVTSARRRLWKHLQNKILILKNIFEKHIYIYIYKHIHINIMIYTYT